MNDSTIGTIGYKGSSLSAEAGGHGPPQPGCPESAWMKELMAEHAKKRSVRQSRATTDPGWVLACQNLP